MDWLKNWGVKTRVSSAHYPQSNGRAKCAVKAAKQLVMGNTNNRGELDTDKFLRARLAYRNSAIYPETGKTIAQSLLGRHLRDGLPAVKGFHELKEEHLMNRKQRELVAAKRVAAMKQSYDKGSKALPPLAVGDRVRVQNRTTIRTTRWDKTGIITATLGDRKYEVMMDGSRRITTRNRRHLRRIPKETVEKEGEEEDDDEDEEIVITTRTSRPSVPAPALALPQTEAEGPAPASARG